ncbi:piggyBac transposable element-derived protein 4-like [Procambarus clarkii]|uniref:piggyBac transposable element-derived protein 4-like n=1 Tax=Procambarus clarkii TaxID=6728 RepID=UPI0037433C82
MRHRMAPHEQGPSTWSNFPSPSLPIPTVPRPASAPGPRFPRHDATIDSRKTPKVFVWSDGTDFVPQIPGFDNSDVGITDIFPDKGADMCEMDYFTAYFDEPLIEYIVHETNKYATDLIDEEFSDYSRLQRWKDTTVGEMYVFFALCMLMKNCVKHVIDHYWSKDHTVPTPMFSKYMSRDRFVKILRCLHFANDEDRNDDDRLWKVRHVLNELIGKYRDFYIPAQKLVIDESLVLFKGRLAFKQYIPSKPLIWIEILCTL